MKSILNPAFRYTSSANTNLEKTFARIRRELAEQKKREAANKQEAAAKVINVRKVK